MNEHEMTDLLERGGAALTPDVGALVAAGATRGRVRRRRRRVGGVAGGLVTAAVVGAVVVVPLSGGGDDAPVATDPAAPQAPAPAPPHAPREPRALAMTAAGVPEVFAGLHPGDVAVIADKENPMDGFDPRGQRVGGPVVDHAALPGEPPAGVMTDFTWNGFYVRAGVAPTDPAFGATPLARCRRVEGGGNGHCESLPGGAALRTGTIANGPADGTAEVNWVDYYTPDNWQVTLMVSNGATSRGGVLAPEPPLSIAQLTDTATSDVWFE